MSKEILGSHENPPKEPDLSTRYLPERGTGDANLDSLARRFQNSVTLSRGEPSTETTPDGLSQHEPGAKNDQGKNRVGLVFRGFAHSFAEVSKVGTFGANKYTDFGFLSVKDGEARYTDAMLRHLLAEELEGEFDKDSGLLHAAHAAWNAMARLEIKLRELGKRHT